MKNKYNNSILAKRYAKALFEYAHELGESSLVYNDMRKLKTYIDKITAFNLFIRNKLILVKLKIEILLEAIQFTSIISSKFIKLIFANSRILIIKDIIIEYQKIYNKINKIYKIQLITAIDIDLIFQKEIINRLILFYKLDINFQYEIDYQINNDLLGGFCIYIETKKLDFTIKTIICHIKKNFIN